MAKYRNLLWVLSSCAFFGAFVASEDHALLVKTKNGTLSGVIMETRRGREFVSFRGIPYALPPLGELRFEVRSPVLHEYLDTTNILDISSIEI